MTSAHRHQPRRTTQLLVGTRCPSGAPRRLSRASSKADHGHADRLNPGGPRNSRPAGPRSSQGHARTPNHTHQATPQTQVDPKPPVNDTHLHDSDSSSPCKRVCGIEPVDHNLGPAPLSRPASADLGRCAPPSIYSVVPSDAPAPLSRPSDAEPGRDTDGIRGARLTLPGLPKAATARQSRTPYLLTRIATLPYLAAVWIRCPHTHLPEPPPTVEPQSTFFCRILNILPNENIDAFS